MSAAPKKKRNAKPGRVSTYSVPITERILTLIVEGWSLRQVCEMAGFPDRRTVMRWLNERTDFQKRYALARILQADSLEEDMNDIEDMTLTGEIDPQAANVVLRSKQWRASKLAPKKYGDKIELGGQLDVSNTIERITRRIVDGRGTGS